MLICLVTETYWPEVNGVAMTLHRWATGLVARGHQIQLVTPRHLARQAAQMPSGIDLCPVTAISMPGYREVSIGLPARKRVRQLWQARRPDVVYVATEGPLGGSAVSEANLMRIPVMSGFHTNFQSYIQFYKAGFLAGHIEKYLVKLHNKTLCTIVPTPDQQLLLDAMGIRDIEIVGRGVDTDLFTPTRRSSSLRASWGVSVDDTVLLYVGRIAEEKNLGLTMQTYEALRRVRPGLKFVFVGDGPALPRLRQKYPEVIFAGRQSGDALGAHYASADIFLFASRTETFGNVVLEAMASGLGLVAFDYAAARLHVCSGRTGLSAALTDDAGFVAQAKRLLQEPCLLLGLREKAVRYAQTQSWDGIVQQLETLLAQALVPRAS